MMRNTFIIFFALLVSNLSGQESTLFQTLEISDNDGILITVTIGDKTLTTQKGIESGEFIKKNGMGVTTLNFTYIDSKVNTSSKAMIKFSQAASALALEDFVPSRVAEDVILAPSINSINVQWDCCQYEWPKGENLKRVKKKDRSKIQEEINSLNLRLKKKIKDAIKRIDPIFNTDKINISISRIE